MGQILFPIQDSKYSTEYINKIIKMGSLWYDEEPLIYMLYDKEKGEFQKDNLIFSKIQNEYISSIYRRYD